MILLHVTVLNIQNSFISSTTNELMQLWFGSRSFHVCATQKPLAEYVLQTACFKCFTMCYTMFLSIFKHFMFCIIQCVIYTYIQIFS